MASPWHVTELLQHFTAMSSHYIIATLIGGQELDMATFMSTGASDIMYKRALVIYCNV